MQRVLTAVIATFLAAQPAIAERPIAIVGATLLDGRGGAPIHRATVVVDAGRIAAVLPRRARLPQGARMVNARGHYLLPGFIDMHAHLLVPRCKPLAGSISMFDRAVSEKMLGALLDFGITFVRSPATPTVEGLRLRDDLNAGRVRGPGALASAELINDPDMTEAELRRYVRDALPHQPDYFKVYARLRPWAVRAVVDEAHASRVPVIAHPGWTTWSDALAAGVDHLTHATDWAETMLRPERRALVEAVIKERGPMRGRIDWLEQLDLDYPEVAVAIGRVAKAGVSLDPTLVAYDSKFLDPSASRYRRNASVDIVPEMHADWRACTTVTRDWTANDYRRWAAAWLKMLRFVRMLHDRGVLLTTGTDVTNPWVIPGESLHQEFELLASAGLPPAAILKMTGENAARALGRRDVGVIEPGRRADLVLLAADPLVDISNTRRIAWVMQGGRVVKAGRLRPTSRRSGRSSSFPKPDAGS